MDKQDRAARKKHHVIYKTTCLVNGHYYIGMHSTDDLADGYIGSGKKLWQSIKRHGIDQHRCEIIEHLPTRQALRDREAELVNVELITELDCMNVALGGQGGWDSINKNRTPEEWSALGKAGGSASAKSHRSHLRVASFEQRSKQSQNAWKNHRDIMLRAQQVALKAASSDEAKAKRKATFKANGHSQGSKNSQYGKCWITNIELRKNMCVANPESFLAEGWKRGRIKF